MAACAVLSASGCGSSGGSVFFPLDLGVRNDANIGGVDLQQGVSLDFAMAPPDLSTPPDLTTPLDFTAPPANCAAGDYVGTVSAMGLGLTLLGPVTLTLGPPQNGVLPVTKGSMQAVDANSGTAATASITGSLDCARLTFNGMLVNGNVLPFNLPFTGTLTASYDAVGRKLQNGAVVIPMLQGNGTWSATRQ